MSNKEGFDLLERLVLNWKNRRLRLDWQKANAILIGESCLELKDSIKKDKNESKIIAECINIVKKIGSSSSTEQMITNVTSSVFIIEKLISYNLLKDQFRSKILAKFFIKNGMEIIAPARGDRFDPQYHEVLEGGGSTYLVKSLSVTGFKKKNGHVVKKAVVILE